jgi:hypothetical protein
MTLVKHSKTIRLLSNDTEMVFCTPTLESYMDLNSAATAVVR